MNTQAIPVAICGGVAVGALVYTVSRPWRRLGPRVDAYTVAARSRLEGPRAQVMALNAPPPTAAGAVAGVFGPIVRGAARRMAALVGHHDEAAVALALDRAGIRGVSPQTYIYQQLLYAVIGLVGGAVVGAVLGGGPAAIVAAAIGCTIGAMRKRAELDRLTRERTERMRAELLTVAQVLAIHARATPNLQAVIGTLCQRGRGEIVGEFRRVLAAIETGTAPEVALNRMADLTPEPAAGGLYRALALAVTTGGDLAGTLLAQAASLRDFNRDERKARATRRGLVILASNASLMVLPLLVLIGAGIPYMVLGNLQ